MSPSDDGGPDILGRLRDAGLRVCETMFGHTGDIGIFSGEDVGDRSDDYRSRISLFLFLKGKDMGKSTAAVTPSEAAAIKSVSQFVSPLDWDGKAESVDSNMAHGLLAQASTNRDMLAAIGKRSGVVDPAVVALLEGRLSQIDATLESRTDLTVRQNSAAFGGMSVSRAIVTIAGASVPRGEQKKFGVQVCENLAARS